MKVKLISGKNTYDILSDGTETVLKLIQKSGLEFNAPCGGKHTCGKCLVKTITKNQPPNRDEIRLLGEKLNQGYRLACLIKAEDGMIVKIPSDNSKTQILNIFY